LLIAPRLIGEYIDYQGNEYCGTTIDAGCFGWCCPTCCHEKCGNCRDDIAPEMLLGALFKPFTPTPLPYFHQRANERYLPVLINGISMKAVGDSGSKENCISLRYAKKIKARESPYRTKWSFFRASHQRTRDTFYQIFRHDLQFCKRALPSFAFPCADFMCSFEPFICDVVLGRRFVRDTGTLDQCQNRFQSRKTVVTNERVVRSIGSHIEEHVHC